jgi:uncharacterized protein YjcR
MPNWDEIRKEFETTKITLVALAEKHGVKLGTLKSRKSREEWSSASPKKDATIKKVATKKEKDATKKNKKEPRRRSGNPNPQNQFTERNTAAKKHGLFSRYIPRETLEIMGTLDKSDPADILWDQIQLQYAAIIRAQEIMYVENKTEMIKELKKRKDGSNGDEREWEFQFAWDRQATFLNAQSRAMGELRSLLKQFDELASVEDERRLKLEQMRLNIDKTKAEVEKIASGDEDDKPIEIIIKKKER